MNFIIETNAGGILERFVEGHIWPNLAGQISPCLIEGQHVRKSAVMSNTLWPWMKFLLTGPSTAELFTDWTGTDD